MDAIIEAIERIRRASAIEADLPGNGADWCTRLQHHANVVIKPFTATPDDENLTARAWTCGQQLRAIGQQNSVVGTGAGVIPATSLQENNPLAVRCQDRPIHFDANEVS